MIYNRIRDTSKSIVLQSNLVTGRKDKGYKVRRYARIGRYINKGIDTPTVPSGIRTDPKDET